jgi:hypothetical protein
MGFLRSFLSEPIRPLDCFLWLGQIGQGLELDQLQAPKRLDWTHWILEHGLCFSRWISCRFRW